MANGLEQFWEKPDIKHIVEMGRISTIEQNPLVYVNYIIG
jgi:hypothetical protein